MRYVATTRSKSGFRGVTYDEGKKARPWRAKIGNSKTGTYRTLGRFATAEDAARAYDKAAREIYGIQARPNFPNANESGQRTVPNNECPNGHDLRVTAYLTPQGSRYCAECNRLAAQRLYHRKKLGALGDALDALYS